MLLFVESMLWSIIGEAGFVVSSVVPSAQALLSFHMPTGKLGLRPRRLRRELLCQNETIPNQINQPTSRPTLRWVFQVLEGIERVRVTVAGEMHDVITGLNAVKIQILRLFGEQVCHMYQLPAG